MTKKLKTIAALSKRSFIDLMKAKKVTDDTIEKQEKIAFISINNTVAVGDTEPPFSKKHPNLITLYFDDVESEIPIWKDEDKMFAIPMNEEQAMELIKFIKRNEDKEFFIIHCAAGISRSGAVASFLNDYFEQNYQDFKEINPHIHPNVHVINLLRRAEQAYNILYPPVENASVTIYPSTKTTENDRA